MHTFQQLIIFCCWSRQRIVFWGRFCLEVRWLWHLHWLNSLSPARGLYCCLLPRYLSEHLIQFSLGDAVHPLSEFWQEIKLWHYYYIIPIKTQDCLKDIRSIHHSKYSKLYLLILSDHLGQCFFGTLVLMFSLYRTTFVNWCLGLYEYPALRDVRWATKWNLLFVFLMLLKMLCGVPHRIVSFFIMKI